MGLLNQLSGKGLPKRTENDAAEFFTKKIE
jgi:hypothetical protein